MATHSSILAWKIPRTQEPGGLKFMGSQRAGHNLAPEHAHTAHWKAVLGRARRSGAVRQGREKARKEFTEEGLTPAGTWCSVLGRPFETLRTVHLEGQAV